MCVCVLVLFFRMKILFVIQLITFRQRNPLFTCFNYIGTKCYSRMINCCTWIVIDWSLVGATTQVNRRKNWQIGFWMDWWQCVDLPLLLFATALLFAPSSTYQRLAHFLDLGGVCAAAQIDVGLSNRANTELQPLANVQGGRFCVPLWLVWKRLNIASNYTMKPGFLFTFLLAGSTIVHACESVKMFFFPVLFP